MTDLEFVLGTGLAAALVVAAYGLFFRPKGQLVLKEASEEEEEKERMKLEVTSERRRVVEAFERERGTKVITLIHRKEPWAEEGDPEYISIEDTEHLLREIKRTPKDRTIDVILHTPGGLALAAEMIATALHEHPAKVTVFIPFYAMSGGTLLALAADEVYMEKFSVMGPVDPQIDGLPASAYGLVLAKKKIDLVADRTIILADIAAMSVKTMKGFVKHLLEEKMSLDRAEKVAEFLTGGYITHDTPLGLDVARNLGLDAREGVPEKVFDLFITCEFGVCERPSLSYGPRERAT